MRQALSYKLLNILTEIRIICVMLITLQNIRTVTQSNCPMSGSKSMKSNHDRIMFQNIVCYVTLLHYGPAKVVRHLHLNTNENVNNI